MTESIQMMAQRLAKAFDKSGQEAANAVVDEIAARYGRDMVLAVIDEWQRQCEFEQAEREAEFDRQMRRRAAAMKILEGLPTTVRFGEACRIKAAQGDPLAQQYLDYFNSREYRLHEGLNNAAVAVHPGWRANGEGRFLKLDDNAPEIGDPLIEWFQKNYPKEAKRIEAEIDAA
jgi:hypothetical protein